MHSELHVRTEQVSEALEALVNRVVLDGDRIVLTAQGKPTAVIVSLADYQYIQTNKSAHIPQNWQSWLDKHAQLMAQLEQEGSTQSLDIDTFLAEAKQERDQVV